MEDLAEKDATEKSDAAREAFLAELARDSRKRNAGVDSSKHVNERTKDKKKSKDHRKNKDSKVGTLSSNLIVFIRFVYRKNCKRLTFNYTPF